MFFFQNFELKSSGTKSKNGHDDSGSMDVLFNASLRKLMKARYAHIPIAMLATLATNFWHPLCLLRILVILHVTVAVSFGISVE